ncbi:MAG: hypothetical protein JXR37_17180 [Kiritimatiellae bacterium]|nr:hypothetical protein [Kiritimatiellia bacterium]
MVKNTALGLVLSALLAAAAGCMPAPSAPCPRDQVLIDRFKTHEPEFDRLASDPDNAELHKLLGIRRVMKQEHAIWFEVWFQDFAGPGGCLKGYALCQAPPQGVVADIDADSDPGGPEEKRLYRLIKDKWYIFYHSSN